jgi:hypothetical protein
VSALIPNSDKGDIKPLVGAFGLGLKEMEGLRSENSPDSCFTKKRTSIYHGNFFAGLRCIFMQLGVFSTNLFIAWGTFVRSTIIRYRKQLVDLLYKLIFLVLDLDRSLMNEKNAHHLPPPVNSKMRPQRAAVKDEIGQTRL